MKDKKVEDARLAVKAVDSIEDIMGRHSGYRRAHARGDSYEATFTPNGEAARWTTASHLQTDPVPALVRFSHASPDPEMADPLSPIKGMAVQFQLPGGQVTNLVGATVPIFVTRKPEVFVEMLELFRSADHPFSRVRGLAKLFRKYPESRSTFKALKHFRAPDSFAAGHYYSINAFYFVNEEGERQPVKYEWEPETDEKLHSSEAEKAFPHGRLEKELEKQVGEGLVHFRLTIQLGAEEDPVDDPTRQWPEEREKVTIGRLSITRKTPGAAESVVFDPTILPDGIEASEDAILHFRPQVYGVSKKRRGKQE